MALVVVADGAAATTGASIYAAALLALFGTSAVYHRLAESPRARQLWQRVDHSMIYVLIAGSYVPLCLVALPRSSGIPILAAIGAMAAVGIALKLIAFHRVQWVSYSLYPVMGWTAVVAAPALYDHLTGLQLGLIVAGGLAYTAGLPVLVARRPDPWPMTFGYHEVWHLCVVIAAALHFVAICDVVA